MGLGSTGDACAQALATEAKGAAELEAARLGEPMDFPTVAPFASASASPTAAVGTTASAPDARRLAWRAEETPHFGAERASSTTPARAGSRSPGAVLASAEKWLAQSVQVANDWAAEEDTR
eukprot:SAG11_NODE_13372_length_658_cov_0.828265_2_plen_121_part_00